jgi:hypothetical protein
MYYVLLTIFFLILLVIIFDPYDELYFTNISGLLIYFSIYTSIQSIGSVLDIRQINVIYLGLICSIWLSKLIFNEYNQRFHI